MSENRKLAAILAADVVGYSRFADEDRTLARQRPALPTSLRGQPCPRISSLPRLPLLVEKA
ncbi:hypothetical protein FJ938_27395 [Mesorhizobium sp. B2-4-14]|nr:hypothetical protein FJ938_27395 [Mesorhizobium sp. B2-4-14]